MALGSYNQTLQKTGKCIAIKAAINRQTMNSSQSDLNVATLKSQLFEAAESAWCHERKSVTTTRYVR